MPKTIMDPALLKQELDFLEEDNDAVIHLENDYYAAKNELSSAKEDVIEAEGLGNPVALADARAVMLIAENAVDTAWKALQELKSTIRERKETIKISLRAMAEAGKRDFLNLQPVLTKTVTAETEMGKVVTHDGYKKYYEKAILNPSKEPRPTLVTYNPGGYTFVTGKEDLVHSMQHPMSANEAIIKFDISYGGYYREIDAPSPTHADRKRKWPYDLVGITWDIAEGESRKVRVLESDGRLNRILENLPPTRDRAAWLLEKSGAEADMDLNWIPGRRASGGGREWLYYAAAPTRLRSDHNFGSYFYPADPAPGLTDLPPDAAEKHKLRATENAEKITKVRRLLSSFPQTLSNADDMITRMSSERRELLKNADDKRAFDIAKKAVKDLWRTARASAKKLRDLLDESSGDITEFWAKYAPKLDEAILKHEKNLQALENALWDAEQVLAKCEIGEKEARSEEAKKLAKHATAAGAAAKPKSGAKPHGAWSFTVDRLRALIAEYEKSYGRKEPAGYNKALDNYNTWVREGDEGVPDSVKNELTKKIKNLNRYFDAWTMESSVRELLPAFERGRVPGGWANSVKRFSEYAEAGYVPPAIFTELKARIGAAEAAYRASKHGDARELVLHKDRFEVTGKGLRLKGTSARVVADTALTARVTKDKRRESKGADTTLAAMKSTDTVFMAPGGAEAVKKGVDISEERKHLDDDKLLVSDPGVGHSTMVSVTGENKDDKPVTAAYGAGASGSDAAYYDQLDKGAPVIDALVLDHFHLDHIQSVDRTLFRPSGKKSPKYFYYGKLKAFVVPHRDNIPPKYLAWIDKMATHAKKLGANVVRLDEVSLDPERDVRVEEGGCFQRVVINGYSIWAFHSREELESYRAKRSKAIGALTEGVPDSRRKWDNYAAAIFSDKKWFEKTAAKTVYYEQTDPSASKKSGSGLPAKHVEMTPAGDTRKVTAAKHEEYVDQLQGTGHSEKFVPASSSKVPPGSYDADKLSSAFVQLSKDGKTGVIVAHDQRGRVLADIAGDIEKSGILKAPRTVRLSWKGGHHGGCVAKTKMDLRGLEKWLGFLSSYNVDAEPTLMVTCSKDGWHDGSIFKIQSHGFKIVVVDETTKSHVMKKGVGGKVHGVLEGSGAPVEFDSVHVERFLKELTSLEAERAAVGTLEDEKLKRQYRALFGDYNRHKKTAEDLRKDVREAAGKSMGAFSGSPESAALAKRLDDFRPISDKLNARYATLAAALKSAVKGKEMTETDEYGVVRIRADRVDSTHVHTKAGRVIRGRAHTASSNRVVPVVIVGSGSPETEDAAGMIVRGEAELPKSVTDKELEKSPDLKKKLDAEAKAKDGAKTSEDEEKELSEEKKLELELLSKARAWNLDIYGGPKKAGDFLMAYDNAKRSKVISEEAIREMEKLLRNVGKKVYLATKSAYLSNMGVKKGPSDKLLMLLNALNHDSYVTESEDEELDRLRLRWNYALVHGKDPGADWAAKASSEGRLEGDKKYFEHMGEASGDVSGKSVKINSVTAYQLTMILKISASLAEAIVVYRTKNGGFTRVDQLLLVRGMDDKTLVRIKVAIIIDSNKELEEGKKAVDEAEKTDEKAGETGPDGKKKSKIGETIGKAGAKGKEIGAKAAEKGKAVKEKYEKTAKDIEKKTQAIEGFLALFDKYETFLTALMSGKGPGGEADWPKLEGFTLLVTETGTFLDTADSPEFQEALGKKSSGALKFWQKVQPKRKVFLNSLLAAAEIWKLYEEWRETIEHIHKAGWSDIGPIALELLETGVMTIETLGETIHLIEQWGLKIPAPVKTIVKRLHDPNLIGALKQIRLVLQTVSKYAPLFQGQQVPLNIVDVMKDILVAVGDSLRALDLLMNYEPVKRMVARSPQPVQKALKFLTANPGMEIIQLVSNIIGFVDEASKFWDELWNSDKPMDPWKIGSRIANLLDRGVNTFDDGMELAGKYRHRLPPVVAKIFDKLKKLKIVRLVRIAVEVEHLIDKVRSFADKVSSGQLSWLKAIVEFGKMVPGLIKDVGKIGLEVFGLLKDMGVGNMKFWRRIVKMPAVQKVAKIFKKLAGFFKRSPILKKLLTIGKALHIDRIAMILIANIDTVEEFLSGKYSLKEAIGVAIERSIKGMVITAGGFMGGIAGRAIGGAVGAAVGSIIPGIGTTILGWVGQWVGDLLGSYLGSKLAEKIWDIFMGGGSSGGAEEGLLSKVAKKVKSMMPSWLSSVIDTLIDKVKGFFRWVFSGLKKVGAFIMGVLENIAPIGQMVGAAIKKALSWVMELIRPILMKVKEWIDMLNPIELAKKAGRAIGRGIKSAGKAIAGFFGFHEKGAHPSTGINTNVGITPMAGRMAGLFSTGASMSAIADEFGQMGGESDYKAMVSFRESTLEEDRNVESATGEAILRGVSSTRKFYQVYDPRPKQAGQQGDDTGDAVEYIRVAWDAAGSAAPGTNLNYGYIKKQNAMVWPKPSTKFGSGPMSWWAGAMFSMMDYGKPEPVRAKSKDGGVGGGHAYSMSKVPSGDRLGAGTQSEMSTVLGGATGLGDVRIHSGVTGSEVASKFNADAVTIGKDIFFGAGQYNPHTPHGKALIGHELTHVVQDSHGSQSHHEAESEALGMEGKLRSHFGGKGAAPTMTHMAEAKGTSRPATASSKRKITPEEGTGPQADMQFRDRVLERVLKLAENERFLARNRYGYWR